MSLTEKEKKELEVLDNPDVQFLSSAFGNIFSNIFSGGCLKTRKKRVVQLRTKMRMGEENLGKGQNRERYHEILEEEEKRFDDRFKNRF